jgi:sugar phosphate isomerase/epimerase
MRLGGPVFGDVSSPERWAEAVREAGLGAAYCPVKDDASDDDVRAFVTAAKKAGIVVAEVGAWSNPLSADEGERRKACEHNRLRLALADRVGARCCVNISGSRSVQWDGPHPLNLTGETFDMIVETVRGIIDAVKPRCTFYTLETMPWMYPDSAESYVRLVKAIDRMRFAVHFDPANLICSPQRYFASGDVIREFVAKLGAHIRSCHAKDVLLAGQMTTRIDEVRPGLGALDYRAFLTELDRLDPDVPLMLEHLKTKEEYDAAASHIRSVASAVGVALR